MSITKIEYPTLDLTRVAATVTHGEIVEKETDEGTLFFKIIRKDKDRVEGISLDLIGFWNTTGNFGTIYQPKKEEVK